ncbi:GNAT family N-acetyltransferase [Micromonospora sp. NPDC049044]|uniref:GNAT family N-acetyltransferase n=1 Tax=unclassified Micromonospora TaxID=2617518 RepID=UPI0033CE2451
MAGRSRTRSRGAAVSPGTTAPRWRPNGPPRRNERPAGGGATTTPKTVGGGAALLAAVERVARTAGEDRIRLDTRDDLVEARALYARHGYVEIPPYSSDRYAEHWFEKQLTNAAEGAK